MYVKQVVHIQLFWVTDCNWGEMMCKENGREESKMNATANIERPCSISESIARSCREVKMMREGKIPKRNWGDFKQRMMNEMAEDE